jgi:hypothetical protein
MSIFSIYNVMMTIYYRKFVHYIEANGTHLPTTKCAYM